MSQGDHFGLVNHHRLRAMIVKFDDDSLFIRLVVNSYGCIWFLGISQAHLHPRKFSIDELLSLTTLFSSHLANDLPFVIRFRLYLVEGIFERMERSDERVTIPCLVGERERGRGEVEGGPLSLGLQKLILPN
ncbi:hypothetical protein TorRG33x02_200270 [Trema orientale]|uniref:Uncharacterized protein n=1 Tax=Trema orientale TaxID=63057 RepID=A0A2P5EF03_TREOI|nr:hypothetical protein TorRG33x02_200270 [Trema orientale]